MFMTMVMLWCLAQLRIAIKALLTQPLATSITLENAVYHMEQVIDAVHPQQDQAA